MDYAEYWDRVLGNLDAASIVTEYDLVYLDRVGLDEWLGGAEVAAGVPSGPGRDRHHGHALSELRYALEVAQLGRPSAQAEGELARWTDSDVRLGLPGIGL